MAAGQMFPLYQCLIMSISHLIQIDESTGARTGTQKRRTLPGEPNPWVGLRNSTAGRLNAESGAVERGGEMQKRRNDTVVGALAASLLIPLITSANPARGDERTDLRVNQELLQQRIDQLAQSGNPGAGSVLAPTTGGPVNVQMTGGSFPRSFLIPGTHTSIRVGGE